MATIGTMLHTLIFGRLVGKDEYGNRYYIERGREPKVKGETRGRKRWVVYNGTVEPTRVPAYWHGWLHYTTDEVPVREAAMRYEWQQPNQPNKTGTPGAYLPTGHTLMGGHRQATASDYEAWTPGA